MWYLGAFQTVQTHAQHFFYTHQYFQIHPKYQNTCTVKPVTRGRLKKCPYMTGVPSSQVHFNVKVYFGSQKMQFRHPNFDI